MSLAFAYTSSKQFCRHSSQMHPDSTPPPPTGRKGSPGCDGARQGNPQGNQQPTPPTYPHHCLPPIPVPYGQSLMDMPNLPLPPRPAAGGPWAVAGPDPHPPPERHGQRHAVYPLPGRFHAPPRPWEEGGRDCVMVVWRGGGAGFEGGGAGWGVGCWLEGVYGQGTHAPTSLALFRAVGLSSALCFFFALAYSMAKGRLPGLFLKVGKPSKVIILPLFDKNDRRSKRDQKRSLYQ